MPDNLSNLPAELTFDLDVPRRQERKALLTEGPVGVTKIRDTGPDECRGLPAHFRVRARFN